MKKKKIFSVFLLTTILMVSIVPTYAQTEGLPENLPEDLAEEIKLSNKKIEIIDDARFKLGDALYIDVSKLEKELEKNDEPDEPNITPFASSMPSDTWNWNNGEYSADWETTYGRTYTRYNFTGYATYKVRASETYRENVHNKGVFSVLMLTGRAGGKGSVVDSSSTSDGSIRATFYNCDPGKKYAFAIEKARDGLRAEGWITIDK